MLRSNAVKATELRQKYPYLTLDEIGNRLGITRERVRQILVKNGLPTHRIERPVTTGKKEVLWSKYR